MRNLLSILLPLVVSATIEAQTTIRMIPGQGHIQFLQKKTGGNSTSISDLKISVEFWGAEPVQDQIVNFSIKNISNPDLAPTFVNTPVGGFTISHNKFNPKKHDSLTFTIHVGIKAITPDAASESFEIQIDGQEAPIYLVTLDANPDLSAKEDPQRYRLMFLNAFNFDFSGALTSNYVGALNFFVPPTGKSHWGYNVGTMKISYSGSDSNTTRLKIENITLRPFDSIGAGSKYLREINKYTTTTQNTVWSIFGQLLYRLTSSDQRNQIYAHLHGELLINKWYTKTTLTNIQTDTMVLTNTNGFVAHSILSNTNNYSTTLLNGYFGFGFTFDLIPWKNANFFLQPIIGWTTNYPQPAAMDISDNSSPGIVRVLPNTNWNSFYLVRGYFSQKLSDSATIIFGTDIRGLFPRYNPQYAIFLGLNIQVESILGLLGIKPKS